MGPVYIRAMISSSTSISAWPLAASSAFFCSISSTWSASAVPTRPLLYFLPTSASTTCDRGRSSGRGFGVSEEGREQVGCAGWTAGLRLRRRTMIHSSAGVAFFWFIERTKAT